MKLDKSICIRCNKEIDIHWHDFKDISCWHDFIDCPYNLEHIVSSNSILVKKDISFYFDEDCKFYKITWIET